MRIVSRRWMTVVALIAALSLIALAAIGCEQEQTKTEPAQKTTEQETGQPDNGAEGKIKPVDSGSFDAEVLNADMPVLVDFYADWCGPCRALHPTLEEIASDYAGRAKVVQVNVDNNNDLASRYNVRGIPALFVIKDGEVVDQTVGLQSKADLQTLLDGHLG